VAEPDGRVRIVIAETDPGIGGNWVNSFSHEKGVWGLRFVKTTTTPPVSLWRLQLAQLAAEGAALLGSEAPVATGNFVD
jgi:hypothetical protein